MASYGELFSDLYSKIYFLTNFEKKKTLNTAKHLMPFAEIKDIEYTS